MAKAIMIQGTMSNAGKSVIAAGLCRIFHQDGYKTAPFKSQNMALNSFITKEGLEMGRAQVMQAEAAGIEPSVEMNPILLKPTNDIGSQVIVNGEVLGTMNARDYFKMKKSLLPDVKKAYDHLAQQYDIIVIEGAGSPAEINLKEDDIVYIDMLIENLEDRESIVKQFLKEVIGLVNREMIPDLFTAERVLNLTPGFLQDYGKVQLIKENNPSFNKTFDVIASSMEMTNTHSKSG